MSRGRLVLLQTFLLELLSLCSIDFSFLCFHFDLSPGYFFISSFISLVTSWLFSSIVFSLCAFVISKICAVVKRYLKVRLL